MPVSDSYLGGKLNTYLTNELVSRSLTVAGVSDSVIDAMTDEEFRIAGTAFVAALVQGATHGLVKIKDVDTGGVAALNSIMRLGTPSAGNEKVFSFSFSNLATEGLFPIFGLLFACLSGDLSPGNAEDAANVGRVLWTSVAVLRSPEDDGALDVLRAIALSKIALAKTTRKYPTNADIAVHCSLSPDALAAALAQLDSKKIIKPVEWGTVPGRYEDDQNTWTVRF